MHFEGIQRVNELKQMENTSTFFIKYIYGGGCYRDIKRLFA